MSNLDDFFKKRDKKKKTTTTNKSKFSTLDTEKLAKNLEAITVSAPNDNAAEVDTDFQNDADLVAPITRVPTGDNLDEEWKPFDSEENKDYTGLRINTNTWKDEEEDGDFDNVTDENSIKTSCPWGASGKPRGVDRDADEAEEDQGDKATEVEPPKTIAAVLAENTNAANVASSSQEPATSAPAPGAYIPPSMRARMAAEGAKPAESKPAAAAAGGAYVPPSMRGRATESSGYDIPTTSVNYRRPNKSQPNLNDCLEFPSLDATGDVPTAADMVSERFEFAKKSGKIEPKNEKDSQIHIQNKFGALSGNQ